MLSFSPLLDVIWNIEYESTTTRTYLLDLCKRINTPFGIKRKVVTSFLNIEREESEISLQKSYALACWK